MIGTWYERDYVPVCIYTYILGEDNPHHVLLIETEQQYKGLLYLFMCGKDWNFIYANYSGIEFRDSAYCQLLYQDVSDSGPYVLELSHSSTQWLTQVKADGCYIWNPISKVSQTSSPKVSQTSSPKVSQTSSLNGIGSERFKAIGSERSKVSRNGTIIPTSIRSKKTRFVNEEIDLLELTNPPVQVEHYSIDDQTQINVFQDGVLIGGTKQRAMIPLLQKLIPQYDEFVYAGHIIGYAYAAIAYGCWLLGVKSTSFVQGKTETTSYHRAIRYGGKVKKYNQSLKYVRDIAEKYTATKPNAYIFPLGFSCPLYEELLFDALVISLPPIIEPKRLWVIAGSGTLLQVFGKLWPDTELLAVLVGKNIWEDQFDPQIWNRITIYEAPQRYGDRAKLLPPYASVSNYDAKIWQFVLKYGQDGDYIWNVAAE